MGQGRHTLRSISDPVYPHNVEMASNQWDVIRDNGNGELGQKGWDRYRNSGDNR